MVRERVRVREIVRFSVTVAGRVWGGGIEGRAGEEDGVHRDPLNKPRVP